MDTEGGFFGINGKIPARTKLISPITEEGKKRSEEYSIAGVSVYNGQEKRITICLVPVSVTKQMREDKVRFIDYGERSIILSG